MVHGTLQGRPETALASGGERRSFQLSHVLNEYPIIGSSGVHYRHVQIEYQTIGSRGVHYRHVQIEYPTIGSMGCTL